MFKNIMAATLMVASLVLTAGVETLAQESKTPVIAVIDYARAMRESKAGQSVRAQVDKQRATYQTEIKGIQTKLETARQELEQQQAVLAPDVFAKKRQEYQKKAEGLQRTAQTRKRSLDQMQAQGFAQIEEALRAILQELVEERGLDIVMNAGPGTTTIVMANRELFVTDEAIKRLDKRLPKVAVKAAAE